MGVSTDWRVDQLPCGAELGAVIDQVAQGLERRRDLHQRSCRFCQAALEETAAAWQPVRVLAAKEVVLPQGLVDSILRRLRGLAQVGWVTLAGPGGVTTVTVRAVAALAEAAADHVPGVSRVGSSFGRVISALRGPRSGGEDEPGGSERRPPSDQREVGVDLRVAMVYGAPIPDVAEEIRRAVRRDVAAGIGADAVEINVEIADVEIAEPDF